MNYFKTELESSFVSLENRRRLVSVKFTNKVSSNDKDHISRRAFNDWKGLTRLHRSATLHFDIDIRKEILRKHSSLDILHEPILPIRPPTGAEIYLNLLLPCSKEESTQALL
ncbi:hypothetical protein TNCV_1437141 [Trichonephila clavipes]|nr:hypothetical protein TNCV_1437141 [Trichonephila clavipes]